MVECDKAIFLMLDQQTQEIIQFTRKEIVKHKWSDLFMFEDCDTVDQTFFTNNKKRIEENVHLDYLRVNFGYGEKPIDTLMVNKF